MEIINDAVGFLLAATRVESLAAWLEDVGLVMSNAVVNTHKDKFWDQFWSLYGMERQGSVLQGKKTAEA